MSYKIISLKAHLVRRKVPAGRAYRVLGLCLLLSLVAPLRANEPYQVDGQLNLGEPEKSFSYPSGHSTRGTVYSLVLAEVFPEKKEAILAIGRDIGWDRVLIGKHFPTDIYAGRVLGKAIVRELLASPAFQRDLAEAKAEVKAAQEPQTVRTAEAIPAAAAK